MKHSDDISIFELYNLKSSYKVYGLSKSHVHFVTPVANFPIYTQEKKKKVDIDIFLMARLCLQGFRILFTSGSIYW